MQEERAMTRYRVTPQADVPQGPSVSHETHIHEGDETSLSVFLSDLQGRTGTPYAAEEWDGEPEPEPDLSGVKAKQDEAEEQGKPVEAKRTTRARSE
jgi:hypothetical protein